jgi:hypothetical protein
MQTFGEISGVDARKPLLIQLKHHRNFNPNHIHQVQ